MKYNVWHILPENDTESHDPSSLVQQLVDNDGALGEIIVSNCKCEPTVVEEEDGIIRVVHNPFDSRPSAYFQNVNKETEESKVEEKKIGALNKNWGLKGFKTAMPGHPVYDDGNRYAIYLEPEKGGTPYRATFYKETLKPWIDFY